jgi:hypothetical protein
VNVRRRRARKGGGQPLPPCADPRWGLSLAVCAVPCNCAQRTRNYSRRSSPRMYRRTSAVSGIGSHLSVFSARAEPCSFASSMKLPGWKRRAPRRRLTDSAPPPRSRPSSHSARHTKGVVAPAAPTRGIDGTAGAVPRLGDPLRYKRKALAEPLLRHPLDRLSAEAKLVLAVERPGERRAEDALERASPRARSGRRGDVVGAARWRRRRRRVALASA